MCRSFFTALFLWLSAITLPAQNISHAAPALSVNDFAGILSFLSSDWMEGREAGAHGGFMAADYIASMMQLNSLLPYGDADMSVKQGSLAPQKRGYFQNLL